MALLELFGEKTDGFYVDVGAHHPKRYSNTHLLHVKGWKGVNIDPDVNAIALFNRARPGDTNINTGVAKKAGFMEYFSFSDPAVNSFVEKEAQRWMKKKWITFLGMKSVPVQPLARIFEDSVGDTCINLLSVDTEGMGLEVLESNDWNRWKPSVIVVEDDVREYLARQGYLFFRACGLSDIYVHETFSVHVSDIDLNLT